MNRLLAPSLVAGVLAAGLFLFVAGIGLGFFFLFLPTLPLFYVGLGRHYQAAFLGSLVATALIALIANSLSVALVFLLCFALPASYIARLSLWWSTSPSGERVWFPIGLIMLRLTLWSCTAITAITLYYANQPETIAQILSQEIHQAFSELEGDYGQMVDVLANEWSFLVFSMTVWLWAIALYAHAWLANRILAKKSRQLRPDFAIAPFTLPNWLLGLILICTLASLIGSPGFKFLGNAVLIALLLPYFFQGCALLHHYSKTWPSRRFFLFFVYFMIFAQFWPALILSGMGLWEHIKRLSAPKTSSKS